MGLDGQPRQLHVEESMQCIDFNDFEPTPQRESESVTSPKVLLIVRSSELHVTIY